MIVAAVFIETARHARVPFAAAKDEAVRASPSRDGGAAEVTGRVRYGLELDPKYADLVVERWQALTGIQATLESDGRTFELIASRDRRKVAA